MFKLIHHRSLYSHLLIFRPFSSIKDRIRKERSERLKIDSNSSLAIKSTENLKKIRNIGIVAHIDAGKTTTTERMLFYAGALSEPGEVHDGNTVMDYMDQERERGITIRAAAISFFWEGYHFNLIDTPGHIDFTGEVERSLMVLDGAVAIFDAVSGVQAQSEMVWLQANKFLVPRIAFINKMDRPGASLDFTIKSIQNKLNVTTLVLQMPLGESEHFRGVIDLLKLESIEWNDSLGIYVTTTPVTQTHKNYAEIMKNRDKLLENLAMVDDSFAEKYLNGEDISEEMIKSSIRTSLAKSPNNICAIVIGSALKNKGIQPLLNTIIDYLPSPDQKLPRTNLLNPKEIRIPSRNEKLLAFAYKVVMDKQKGPLVYVRLYAGKIAHRTQLKNVSREITEKPHHLYRVRANSYVNLTEVSAGDIAAISGLKGTQSGDTIVEANEDSFLLEQIKMPEPVFFAALEYEYVKDKTKLEISLKEICKEDSSLTVKEDPESGQLLVSGLGELHLEVLRDRLEIDYGLKTHLSKFRVSYRETILNSVKKSITVQKNINGRPLYAYLELEIEQNLEPTTSSSPLKMEDQGYRTNSIEIIFSRNNRFNDYYNEFRKRKHEAKKIKKKNSSWSLEDDEEEVTTKTENSTQNMNLKIVRNPNTPEEIEEIEDDYGEDTIYSAESVPFDILWSVEDALSNSFYRGILLGSPMMNVKIVVCDLKYSIRRSNPMVFQMATVELIKEMYVESQAQLLEPVMDVEISTPNPVIPPLLNDIINVRRGKVGEIVQEGGRFNKQEDGQRSLIHAIIPLEASIGYATYLRTMTKGEGSFIMKFKQFDFVGAQRQRELMENPP